MSPEAAGCNPDRLFLIEWSWRFCCRFIITLIDFNYFPDKLKPIYSFLLCACIRVCACLFLLQGSEWVCWRSKGFAAVIYGLYQCPFMLSRIIIIYLGGVAVYCRDPCLWCSWFKSLWVDVCMHVLHRCSLGVHRYLSPIDRIAHFHWYVISGLLPAASYLH